MRRGLCLAACLLLWLFPGGTALGAEDTAAVYDYAGLLSSSETAALEENARDFSDSWNMNVVFLTTDDTGDKDSESYADDFYMDNGYYDNGMDGGILFLIDMDNRQVWISTAHDMRYYLTDERLEDVIDAGDEELTEEKYALCFENMLDETERFMERALTAGNISTTGKPERSRFTGPLLWERDCSRRWLPWRQGPRRWAVCWCATGCV